MNKTLPNVILIVTAFAIAALFTSCFKKEDKRLSPQGSTEFKDKDLSIKMIYCRPYKKGRLIFGPAEEGALQPFGVYWRLGANEATTLETNKELVIEGNVLPAGNYSMYAIPGDSIWKFGINKVADRWGKAEPDYSQDLFTFERPVTYTEEIKEQFTITIGKKEGSHEITFWWDTSKIDVPFEVKK